MGLPQHFVLCTQHREQILLSKNAERSRSYREGDRRTRIRVGIDPLRREIMVRS
jgi:hypothetical protein